MAKDKLEKPTEDLSVRNFTNIDSEDFEGMWGGVAYPVKAGKTTQFPGFMVDHFAGQLAKKILLRQGGNFMDDVKTPRLIAEIKGEVEVEPEEEVEAPKEAPKAKPKAKKVGEKASANKAKKEKAFPKKPKAKK